MSSLTAANLSKMSSNDTRDDDAISIGSACSVGSVMSKNFNMNIKRKMSTVNTVEDVRRNMTKHSLENEDAFWAYAERKATRNIKAGKELSPVEVIAMDRKKAKNKPLVVNQDYKSLLDELEAEYNSTGGLDEIIHYKDHPKFYGKSKEYWDGFWKYTHEVFNSGHHTELGQKYEWECSRCKGKLPSLVEEEVYDEYTDNTYFAECDDARFKAMTSIVTGKGPCNVYEDEESLPHTLHTGQSALTDVTLVGRYYKPAPSHEDQYIAIMRDTANVPPPEILEGLPHPFHPFPGVVINPYGHRWDEDRYIYMCKALHSAHNTAEDNARRLEKSKEYTQTQIDRMVSGERHKLKDIITRMLVVMVWYFNRYKIYVKSDRSVYRILYNENTGLCCGIDHVCDWSREESDEQYDARLPMGKKSTDTVLNLWKQHPGRTRVADTTFKIHAARMSPLYTAPGINPERLNTFFGFKVELDYNMETYPILYANDRFDISLITNHIEQKYFENDLKHIRWFKRWLYEILWLKRRTDVACVFFGEQGTGKTLIVDELIGKQIMGTEAGNDYNVFTKNDNFEGWAGNKFNSSFQNKLLINVDEVKNAHKHDSMLKALITNTANESEEKFKNRTSKTNYTNLWLTSNQDTPFLRIDPDDRRFFIKRINKWWKGVRTPESRMYFDALVKCIKHPRAAVEFMMWVKEAETYDVDVRNIPVTPEKLEFIAGSTDLTWKWVNEMVIHRKDVFTPGIVIEQQAFVDMYNDKYGDRYRATPQMFSKVFRTLGFDVVSRQPIKLKIPPMDHIVETMKELNKWVDS